LEERRALNLGGGVKRRATNGQWEVRGLKKENNRTKLAKKGNKERTAKKPVSDRLSKTESTPERRWCEVEKCSYKKYVSGG